MFFSVIGAIQIRDDDDDDDDDDLYLVNSLMQSAYMSGSTKQSKSEYGRR